MITGKNPAKGLGILSLAGSFTAVPLVIAFARTGWGAPGSTAYQTYELLNRLMTVSLLMMAAGWLGLALRIPAGYGRWGARLGLLASLVMAAGSAAEFYLFSHLPYELSNQRDAAWTAFLLGSLLLPISAAAAGAAIWRRPFRPRWAGMLLVLALPVQILAFFTFSPFLGPAVLALAAGWLLLSNPDPVFDPPGSGQFSVRDGQAAGGAEEKVSL